MTDRMPGQIDWTNVAPTRPKLDTAHKVRVPQDVLDKFQDTKSLGKAIARELDGDYVVRTIDGAVYAVPIAQ